jgi:hypothetical protein
VLKKAWFISYLIVPSINSRRQFNSKIFREIIMVTGWCIWCHRNAIIFDDASVSLGRLKAAFKDEFAHHSQSQAINQGPAQ